LLLSEFPPLKSVEILVLEAGDKTGTSVESFSFTTNNKGAARAQLDIPGRSPQHCRQVITSCKPVSKGGRAGRSRRGGSRLFRLWRPRLVGGSCTDRFGGSATKRMIGNIIYESKEAECTSHGHTHTSNTE